MADAGGDLEALQQQLANLQLQMDQQRDVIRQVDTLAFSYTRLKKKLTKHVW